MTDFRALATELLAALAYVNKHQKIPDGFLELEQRAAAAVAEPTEIPLPLLTEKQFRDAAAAQVTQLTQNPPPQLPADASPLVRVQETMRRKREKYEKAKRVPGASWM